MTRRGAGFTLIEVAVALALAALVSLTLVEGLRLTTGGVARLTQRADRLDARHGVDPLLRRALEAAVAGTSIGGQPGFAGEAARLDFVTLAETGGPGLYRLDLALDGADLVLTRRLAEPSAEPQVRRSVLASRVRRFAVAYFGAPSPGEPPSWHASWQGISFLPRLVRVTIDTGDDAVRFPITVRLWNAG
jgi:prepilin-type N-terminal cleavage/methylation domain-containing protein